MSLGEPKVSVGEWGEGLVSLPERSYSSPFISKLADARQELKPSPYGRGGVPPL